MNLNFTYMYHTMTRKDGTIEVHEREASMRGDKIVPATYGKMYEISADKIETCIDAYHDLLARTTLLPDNLDMSNEGTTEERLQRCFSNIKKIEIHNIARVIFNRLSHESEQHELGGLLEDKSA